MTPRQLRAVMRDEMRMAKELAMRSRHCPRGPGLACHTCGCPVHCVTMWKEREEAAMRLAAAVALLGKMLAHLDDLERDWSINSTYDIDTVRASAAWLRAELAALEGKP